MSLFVIVELENNYVSSIAPRDVIPCAVLNGTEVRTPPPTICRWSGQPNFGPQSQIKDPTFFSCAKRSNPCVSFASALLFLGNDFRHMVYPDLSFLFSLFHTPKLSVSKKVMLAFEFFPITSLVRCFITQYGLDHRGYVHPTKCIYQYEAFFT